MSTVYSKSFFFFKRWVHFPLKDQADYIWHNSTIKPLLPEATRAKNMLRSNAAKEGENANGQLR